MIEVKTQGMPSLQDLVRSLLSAVSIDKTYGDITQQKGTLIAGNTYYTQSDIQVYESQIETLKTRLSEYATEIKNKDVSIQSLREQYQSEIAKLNTLIQVNQHQVNQPIEVNQLLGLDADLYSFDTQPQNQFGTNQNQSGINQNQSGTNQNQSGINQSQSGIELSAFGINKPIPVPIPLDMEQIIQDKFLEVVGNELVVEYFNQKTKLNQSFGISGFSGTFQVVEEIPNSLLEHHPLVVYWKKQVGQYENAIVNAIEAFFNKYKTVQQISQMSD